MATIYEVAALAGVSPATVSRVLNGAAVSPEKVRLVREAAEQLQFTPNRTARRLRNQSSELIALLIPDVENPFFTALARGVEDKAQAAGFSVVLCNTDDDPAKETRYLDIANSEDMAGVILAPASEDGDIRHVTDRGRPVVAVDRNTGLTIDSVMVDNRAAGVAATTALFDAGYERVACIAGPLGLEWTEERSLGWRQVVSKRGAGETIDRYLQHANYRVDGGRAAMAALLALDSPPDAVVTTNNLMGVGALQALSEAGITPPDFGVAVVGDLPFSTLHPDAITQVHLPARHLGTTAATMLLERIAGDDQPARTVVLRADVTRGAARPAR
ncbi:LacI family DNA-binding transcriptional regulator [Salinibacterium soli]|uniref:LacI family DNA-binding transcriptional regulator n=1 Tax=Antiquaquibacter soli TaxID=3064523 RepID=A0ABT9BKW4_9MICO|nr:LacI family DNA-binding transcriptional regulator [Protaetiibacter sp. WY-16]MDO7881661.1 LacI family DNA-binding transcriptional regulator [Protaetiibacter sp. WY-16]